MKKLESSLLNMVLVLTGVAVIMGGILAYVNHLTSGPINEQKEKALADGIKTVMVCEDLKVAKTDTVKQNDAKGKELTYIIYQTQDKNGKDLGAAVESTTGGLNMPRPPVWAPRLTNGSKRERKATLLARTPAPTS